jgi:hypothetical protein
LYRSDLVRDAAPPSISRKRKRTGRTLPRI